jgi:predicted component of type VI protein secretion system
MDISKVRDRNFRINLNFEIRGVLREKHENSQLLVSGLMDFNTQSLIAIS